MTTYKYLWTDAAQTALAAGITAASPSLQVVSGGGALFPALTAPGTAFLVTLFKNGSPAITEVMLVTGRSGDNFTGLTRNVSGTGALAWNAGDTVAIVPTAEALNYFMQAVDLQQQAGNYAQDNGVANAYIAILTPAVNARSNGLFPVHFFVQHPNTGPSTLNDGLGAVNLLTADGEALRAGDLQQYSICAAYFDGAAYRLLGVHHLAFTQLNGAIANGQVPQSAVTQFQAALAIAWSQLTGSAPVAVPGNSTTNTQTAGDSSTKLATTAFVNPGVTTSSSGTCIRLPSGHKLQFGTVNPNGGTVAVTYPVPFTSVAYPVAISDAGGPVQTWLSSRTLNGFNLSNSGGSSIWIAVGL